MQPSSRRGDRVFFSLAGAWFVALTFVGFSPTFFLRSVPGELPAHQIVHGVVFSAWVVLFFVQALLISTHHMRWHMKLGAASLAILLLMIPVGFHVVLVKAAAGDKSIDDAGFNLAEMTLGFAFAFAGLANRKRPFVHKRLMLFATLMLTVAAADRVAFIVGLEEIRAFRKLLAMTPGIATVAYDALYHRRIPILSATLLTLVWLVVWFIISDYVFTHAVGEWIIDMLTRVFVW